MLRKRIKLAAVTVIMLVSTLSLTLCLDDRTPLVILHAGSLAVPFGELEKEFEAEHPDVDVRREAAGSAMTIRKVTELNKVADVMASADYTLIESMMMNSDPAYANFYIEFAENRMSLAYTEQSAYHRELNRSNWIDVLARENVRFGFSNPNDDPCGYRSMMVIQLAELYYNRSTLFEDLIEANTGISSIAEDDGYNIEVPETPRLDPDRAKVMMRSAEIDLMGALELGEIDYLFIYRSVASQHAGSGVEFMELPEEIDLSSAAHRDSYGKVWVTQSTGNVVKAKPIVYGITIPENAKDEDLAVEFIQMLFGETGREIFRRNGQPPVFPGVASDTEKVPGALKDLVV